MRKFDLTKSFIYRRRFLVGYTAIALLLALTLFVAGFMIPGEISDRELSSIISTASLNLSSPLTSDLTNASFRLLQHISLSIFGVTLLGIKLPAFILGLTTAIFMVLLLRRWFKPGVAVLTSVLVVTTGQFLFVAQDGATGILYLFWPTALLLLATLVANRTKHRQMWQVLFFITIGLSLYTPLSIYVLIAMASSTLLHPHLRMILRRMPKSQLITGTAGMLIILTPLAISTFSNPQVGLALLGIPNEWPNFLANLKNLAYQYINLIGVGSESVLLPVFGLASLLLIGYGLVRIVKSHATVQSYVILTWLVLLLPVVFINQNYVSIMFVPQILLLAAGLEGLLNRWYKLFPKNPYARVAGLVPIVILVSSMTLSGLERYTSAYRYAPEVMQNFTRDLVVIPEVETLVVAQSELDTYTAVAKYKGNLSIVTTAPSNGRYAVTAKAYDGKKTPSFIVANNRAENGASFYIYR